MLDWKPIIHFLMYNIAARLVQNDRLLFENIRLIFLNQRIKEGTSHTNIYCYKWGPVRRYCDIRKKLEKRAMAQHQADAQAAELVPFREVCM